MRRNIKERIRFGHITTRARSQITNGSPSLTLMQDGNIFYGNQRVGYLDEADVLFGMNRHGYAVQIGPSDRRTACDMLREWLNEAHS